MTRIDVTVIGDEDAQRLLRGMRQRMRDYREPFTTFGAVIEVQHAATFAAQGRPRWKALKPAYAAWKLKRVGPKPILQFTGELLKDLTTGLETRMTRKKATYGTSNMKAIWHEYGTKTPMRARPFFVKETDRPLQSMLVRLIADHILGDEDDD